jgi:hypothetical protein
MCDAEEPKPQPISLDSAATLNYLTTLQGVITRLAANSGSCKTLCITITSAIIVVITNKAKPEFAWVTFFPIITLGILDAYYLGLERSFRNTYNTFTKKLIINAAYPADLFKVIPSNPDNPTWFQNLHFAGLINTANTIFNTLKSCTSPAIWLFYIPLLAIVQIGKNLIFSNT